MRTSKTIGSLVAIGVSLAQLSCSVFGIRSEETPKYETLVSEDDKEVRSYSSYVVATTKVKGEFKEVQNEAFRILAGYIFGDNQKKQSISMTAPVVQSQTAEAQSEKISMTAPVMQTATEDGWTMSFMMPSKYKMEDLPRPNDQRIEFAQIPPRLYAVIRYSGRGRDSDNQERARELSDWISKNKDYRAVSKASYAGFDPPWTIPFLRRNEMMIQLEAAN